MKILGRILTISGLTLLGMTLMYFGTSMLDNQHLAYIRYTGKDVVYLINKGGGGGTGFVVKAKSGTTYIMTNHHICASAGKDPLMAIYRGDKYIVPVIRNYVFNDLCVVQAPGTATSPMKVASSVNAGERVYAIGHPLLEPLTVTEGELSANVEVQIEEGLNAGPDECKGPTYELIDLKDNPLAQIFGVFNVCIRHLSANSATIPILPGNSGSPIVNIYGHVVGVAFAANESGTHSYVVPLDHLQDFLGEL